MTEYQKQYQEAVKAGETKTISPTYVEFKKAGDVVVGLLKGKTVVESSRGQGSYNQYMVDTDKGMVKFALGQATDREIEPVLKSGNTYAFIFEGKEKLTGGRSVNKFKVVEFGRAVVEDEVPEDDLPF